MVEVQDVPFGTLVGDVRVRVDLTKIGKEFGGAAIVARGHRREYLGGAVVVEAFNVTEVGNGSTSST
jgi:hypothetical protein